MQKEMCREFDEYQLRKNDLPDHQRKTLRLGESYSMKESLLRTLAILLRRLTNGLDMAHGRHQLALIKSKGHGVGIWGKASISGHDNIVLGNNVHIGKNAFIKAEGGLRIGDNTHISRNLVLYTMNHR